MCMEDEWVILIPRNNDLVSDRFWMGLIFKESQQLNYYQIVGLSTQVYEREIC